jgi:HlyD family secretion protein
MISKKWIVVIIAAGVIAGGGFWLYHSVGVAASAEDKDLLSLARVNYPLLVTAPGVLEAARSVSIGAPKIPNERRFKLSRMVDEAVKVSEGDFLLEFDGSDISRRLRDETANYQRVQEEYQKKRSDLDIQLRNLKLQLEQARADFGKLENKIGQQEEIESAMTVAETKLRRDMAKKQVELLEKKVAYVTESGRLDLEISRSNQNHYKTRMDNLLDALDALTVTAPVSGVVIYKRDWNNEAKQIGSYVFVLDQVLEIPDLSTLRAKVMVDEMDAGKVQAGQEARITVDAVQGKTWAGKVTSISAILKQATYDRPQKITEAVVEFSGADLALLRPGMSARVMVQVGSYPDSIVIPLSSIRERDGRSFVQVWNVPKRNYDWREIQLKNNDGDSVVVSEGLQANEKIRVKPSV